MDQHTATKKKVSVPTGFWYLAGGTFILQLLLGHAIPVALGNVLGLSIFTLLALTFVKKKPQSQRNWVMYTSWLILYVLYTIGQNS